uniref:SDR family NAD(P)-dependent oxidoreductase n=1 Tax=Marinobacterium profundum TaxID=1714300 RepID=UPI00083524D7|nr:SDR family oxidoreductase [Marinobacterium profundum]
MELNLKGRTAVITGASKGVGKGVARALAAEGVNLVMLARGEAQLNAAAKELAEEFSIKALPVATDVTDTESVRHAAREARKHFGTFNILVNNAGAAIQRQDREITWDDSDWLSQVQVKSLGALRTIREFLPAIAQDGTGRLITITGASGSMTWMPALTYGMNNAALIHMTGYLAADLAAQKVTANTIVPGIVGTEWRHEWAAKMGAAQGKDADSWMREFCTGKGIISGRWAQVQEVADMAVFLASDRAAYINGAKIAVDGGLTTNVR